MSRPLRGENGRLQIAESGGSLGGRAEPFVPAFETMAVRKEKMDPEQAARERGRALPHYTKKVVKELARPAKPRKLTPPKRAGD